MPIDSSLFLDVSDALGLGNPAIVEKDYYVVALLKLLSELSSDTHSLVFSGGTALAKSGIKTHRMSEDVDIKIIPKNLLAEVSKTQKRKARRELHHQVLDTMMYSPLKVSPSFLMSTDTSSSTFAILKLIQSFHV